VNSPTVVNGTYQSSTPPPTAMQGGPAGRPRHARADSPTIDARRRRGGDGPRFLGRFGIRGKLNILLLLALATVLLVSMPFLAGQVDNARSAGDTANSAQDAKQLGGLIWELQRERLVTTAYLAAPNAAVTTLAEQQRTVDSIADQVKTALGPDASDELAASLVRLGSLKEPRQSALLRAISSDRVARTYHAVIGALIDALRLVPQDTGDASGTRQLAALDALLRANEFNAEREMALIAAAVDPQTGLVLLGNASAQAPLFIEQFVQQADADQAALVVQVDQGEGARRINDLARTVTTRRQSGSPDPLVTDAFSAATAQLTARRTVQDQVTSQIADAATNRASRASLVALFVGIGAIILFGLVAALAIALSRSIANPLRRLTSAATTVADLANTELTKVTDSEESNGQVPHLPPIEVSSSDELGQLAAAFNRVQSTATMLVERQAVRRTNVSLMFANVAQRTQNLVGRQLVLVDELERNEQDGRLLASLYRLDHLSTRLRRTADNLLVVAGSRGETRITGPIPLTTALRSALGEIEEYQRVKLDSVEEITLRASVGSDAVLMFAELLDNATSFSPPQSIVEIRTEFPPDGSCLVSIVDQGIGMTAERLAEENGRLLERERLDIAPTKVLGLFVIGRLARRHSLGIQLVETPGGGVTAEVAIPATLYIRDHAPDLAPVPVSPPVKPPQRALPPELVIPAARHQEGFSWFPDPDPEPVGLPASSDWQPRPEPALSSPEPALSSPEPALSSPEPAQAGPGPSRGGLQRRVPGAQLVKSAMSSPTSSSPPASSQHDAAAARDTFAGYQSAIAQATGRGPTTPAPAGSPTTDRAGLSRRVPGANLAPALRSAVVPTGADARASGVPQRDPDAELAVFDAFSAGLARADRAADSGASPPAPVPTPARWTPVPQPRVRQSDLDAQPTNGSNA
jgi:signal transduction histidine kinase